MAECCIAVGTAVVGKCTEILVDPLLKLIWNRITRVFKSGSNVKTLKEKAGKLVAEKQRVLQFTEAAERRGEEAALNVMNWLTSAEKYIGEMEKLGDDEDKSKKKCFAGLCPNPRARYQISKKVEEYLEAVAPLLEEAARSEFLVSYWLPPKEISTGAAEGFEQFESRMPTLNRVMEALRSASVEKIGIHGLPGVGKTTLAKEVARQAGEEQLFDVIVMASVKKDPDLKKIQGEIADKLGLQLQGETEFGRAIQLKGYLNKKKILVILDDIWARLDLGELGIPFENKKSEASSTEEQMLCKKKTEEEQMQCKILLTSRDLNVLSRMGTRENIEVGTLQAEEAWTLLKRIVGDEVENSELPPTAKEIVGKCAGLPLAVEAVAKALKGKDAHVWRDALVQLKRPCPESFTGISANVYSAIELSYNHLGGKELQQTFLLCCLLGHNSSIEDLLMYGIGLDLFGNVKTTGEARDRVLTLVNNLKSSSLLLDGRHNGLFDMHDIVHDVAILIALMSQHLLSIAEDNIPKEWSDREALENFKWISLQNANVSELPDELECPQLTLFYLDSKDPSMKIPENFFRGTQKLRVLDFTNMCFSSLPSSICLLKNLHTLHVNGGVLEDMAIIGKLTSLEVLSLAQSDIVEVPTEIGQLTQLKLLDLSDCTKLKMIQPHVLASLSKLEELYLRNSFDQWDVGEGGNQRNASLAELKYLHNLAALDVHVCDVQQIPKVDLLFQRLTRYKIFIGDVWSRWDSSFKSSNLLKLELNTSINFGHSIFVLLKKTEELHLEVLKGFKNVVYELEDAGFQELKYLHVKNAPEVEHIVNLSVGSVFPLLEELFLQNLDNLVKICTGRFRGTSFSQLSIITVKSCDQLKNLFPFSVARQLHKVREIRVMECSNMTEIVDEELQGVMEIAEGSETFELGQLRSLQLQYLPKFIRLCHGNEETNDPSSNSAPLFDEKIVFPNLEELQLSCINIKSIWGSQLSIASSCIQILTKLIIEGCDHLEHLLSSSMAKSLVKLRRLEIKKCKEIREIIEPENAEDMEDMISFPMLEILKIEYLEKHTGFCTGNCSVEFPALKQIFIEHCPELKGFTVNHASTDMTGGLEPLFNEKVSFPSLENLSLQGLELRIIWHHQLPANSYCKLKSLFIGDCDKLSTIFSSDVPKRLCASLERLDVYRCCGVEQIFEIGEVKVDGVTHTQFRHVHLCQLPRLKHVCTRDPRGTLTFQKLQSVKAHNCPNLQNLFQTSVAMELQQLEMLELTRCGIEEVVAFGDGDEAVPTFVFSCLSTLSLWDLKKLKCFYPRKHVTEWPMLKNFSGYHLEGIKETNVESLGAFPVQLPLFTVEKVIPRLEKLSLTSDDIAMICTRQFPEDFFSNVKALRVLCYHSESTVFPFFFVERFFNLEKLFIGCSCFKELFPSIGSIDCQEKDARCHLRIRKLKLDTLSKLKYIWSQGSASDLLVQNVQSLKVLGCDNLISLSESTPSFQNLTKLLIVRCQGLKNLFSFATAQSLVQLQSLTVEDCHFLTEIVGGEGDGLDSEDVIDFSILKFLKLKCLTRLASFCSSNFTFKFPLLEEVMVAHCVNFETFCHGVVETPRLQRIQLTQEDKIGRPVVELNGTINQLYKEKVGFAGLTHLKLSEFPQLMEIWNKNPQQSLDFRLLCSLEICNCGNLRYLLTPSMALSLVVLEVLQVQNCKMIEHIITGEEAIEVAKNKMIFRLLQTIILQSCFNLESFCLGSYGLEFPSLFVMNIIDCPKMATFASPFSTVQLKKAVDGGSRERIGKDTDIPSEPFFSDEVAFPLLEELRMAGLENLRIIWHHQPHADSFCKLKSLVIENCGKLLTIFSSDMLGRLCKSLEVLTVRSCSSLEEIFELGEVNIEESHGVLDTLLRELTIRNLPRLRHVWTKDPQGILSFRNLQSVIAVFCPKLQNMFPASVAMEFQQLKKLTLASCGIEEVVAFGGEEAVPRFVFSCLSTLYLWNLPRLICFYPRKHVTEWPMLKKFRGFHFEGIWETNAESLCAFPVQLPLFIVEKVIPRLEKLSLTSDDIAMICTRQFPEDFFSNVKALCVLCYHSESTVFPFFFIERFFNLEKLFIGCSYFKELFPSRASIDCQEKDARWHLRIRKLKLDKLPNLKYIWSQGSASDLLVQNIESLQVRACENLISLSESTPSFRNLTTLLVQCCQGLRNLFSFATAQSLVQLQRITVEECHLLTEIVGGEGVGLEDVTVFSKLKVLKLKCLTRLASFCSANSTFKFPLLEEVMVAQCVNFVTFCHGVVRTPRLQRIQLTQEDNAGRPVVELNDTINQLYKEKVVFSGLQYLKLSDFPQLVEIWNKDPQEILDFKQLCVLEICNCSDLKYLLTPSMTLSLVSLIEMKVKNCEMMEQIVTEEEATGEDEKEMIFPLTKTINLESCPNLTSFCVGNYKLECPSLAGMKLLDCPKMVTFASTFSTVQVKEAAEGGSAERIGKEVIDIPTAPFFSDEATFPSLEELIVERNESMKEIWHGDDVKDGIVFTKLESLQLKVLPKLESFCSGNCNFEFPSLVDVTVMECPNMLTFSEGEVSTPKLQKVKLTENSTDEGIWQEGGLNPTIQELFTKKNGDDAEEDWSDALHKLFD
ncbi:hypothetical protein SLE2022_204940 [Rubroshorea leprosula]